MTKERNDMELTLEEEEKEALKKKWNVKPAMYKVPEERMRMYRIKRWKKTLAKILTLGLVK